MCVNIKIFEALSWKCDIQWNDSPQILSPAKRRIGTEKKQDRIKTS